MIVYNRKGAKGVKQYESTIYLLYETNYDGKKA